MADLPFTERDMFRVLMINGLRLPVGDSALFLCRKWALWNLLGVFCCAFRVASRGRMHLTVEARGKWTEAGVMAVYFHVFLGYEVV